MPVSALHAALGLPPGPVTRDLVVAGVEAGVQEGDRLDWKSALPPQKKLAESDLPKDVAAFANAAGGLLIYGVEESDGAATAIGGVSDFNENFERSIRDCVLRAISPPVYNVQIEHLADVEGGKDVVVVTVPQSPEAPHLIRTTGQPGFRVPRRSGRDTRWLTEPELAEVYRLRFARRSAAQQETDSLYERTYDAGRRRGVAWFVGVARPAQEPWRQPRRRRDEVRTLIEAAKVGVDTTSNLYIGALDDVNLDARPAMRGWTAPPSRPQGQRQASVTVLDDGSVALAASAGGQRAGHDGEQLPPTEMESRALESYVVDLFSLIEEVGRAAGITEYDVKIGVEANSDDVLKMWSLSSGYLFDTGATIERVTPVRATVSLKEPLRAQLRDVALDLVNQGGVSILHVVPDD